ncbi:MAG TPA: penicillin-binding protein 2 [Candidatus Limnocylindrales bacterium]|jgi:cell division protein FtsI/penicillin-binding protein 2
MLGRTDSRPRLLLLLVGLVVISVALVGRLGYWQVLRRDELADQARRQTTVRTETPSRRGSIYDRSGVVVLATTIERQRLVASPDDLTPLQRRDVRDRISRILHIDDDPEAVAALDARLASDRSYVVLATDIGSQAADAARAAVRAGELPTVRIETEPSRVYPQAGGGPESTLAAQLLGFVNRDGVGQYGVEQRYQDVLAGRPQVVLAQRDVRSRPIGETATVAEAGEAGVDLRLTIDAGLQLAVEQELLAARVADRAKSVSAIVMDPYSGEIYAEATYPSYDANAYRKIAADDPSRFVDPIVSEVYEPGSVFKMLTVIAGLETRTVTPTTRIRDTGTLRLDNGESKIDDADRRGMGWMTFRDGIAYSRNVVAAKVALDLGRTTRQSSVILHDTWTRMGFGARTGIDVAGEVPGLVRDPRVSAWHEIDLANGSFGQGVAVTPIQLVTAYATMINGGMAVTPHVVKSVGTDDVSVMAGDALIQPQLSKTLVSMMNHVVTEVPFYSDRTLIPGYYVGGKTGTAQIWDSKARQGRGAWKDNLFNYSFVGFIGRETGHPDLVVAVRVEEARPTIARVGRLEMPVMSFQLFRRIAHDAIATPDLLEQRVAPLAVVSADR